MEVDAQLEGIEWMHDIIPGRNDPENLRILSWGSTVEGSSWGFRIWSDQISSDFNQQRWVEILDTTNRAASGGEYQQSISIRFYCIIM